MPYPITRIPTDAVTTRHAREEELRAYIEGQLLERYAEKHPDLLLDVSVARRSDYDAIKVFLTKAALLDDAQEFMQGVEDQLAADGIPTVIYVRSWTGPTDGGGAA